jgi:8-oxo-dGTP pyrophosphatase MutT (NUDIX family)
VTQGGPPVVRHAVRVILLDEHDRVLLVRHRDGPRWWWCAPGGAIEPGESEQDAAVRELREETGLASVDPGPCIWTRRHRGTYQGQPFDQSERIYLARVATFEPQALAGEAAAEGFDAIRWWTMAELTASVEEFAPRTLADRLRSLLTDGPPATPIDVGV